MKISSSGVATLDQGHDTATAAGARRLEAAASLVLWLQLAMVVISCVFVLAQPFSPAAETISGRVFAPPGATAVRPTVVTACAVRDGRCDPASPDTHSITVEAAAPSAPFKIGGLVAGPYMVVALHDVNGDGVGNGGDWVGTVPDGAPLGLHAPARAIELRLQVIRVGR